MKKMLALLLTLVCVAGCATALAEADGESVLGMTLDDFTFTSYDGTSSTMSGLLAENDAILLEFILPVESISQTLSQLQQAIPIMERVAVLCIDCSPQSTAESMAAFAQEQGLTFPIGADPADFVTLFGLESVPTHAVIDRFGVVCYVSDKRFSPCVLDYIRLMRCFTGEGYTASQPIEQLPEIAPDVETVDEELIATVLNKSGYREMTFSNPKDETEWPMLFVEHEDGTPCMRTSNSSVPNSVSSLTVTFYAEAGDLLIQDYRSSTEFGRDELTVTLNGEVIKHFSGERDWKGAVYEIPETGEYTAELRYVKDESVDEGNDCLWIDYFSVYPPELPDQLRDYFQPFLFSDEAGLLVTEEGAREIVFDDENMLMFSLEFGGNMKCYVVPSDSADLQATFTPDMDPDRAYIYVNDTEPYFCVGQAASEYGFCFNVLLDTLETTGHTWTYIRLFPSVGEYQTQCVVLFAGEETLSDFIRISFSNPTDVHWRYVDEEEWRTVSENKFVAPNINGRATAEYRLTAYDMSGARLGGVEIELASETDTYTLTTDEMGTILAELPAAEYHFTMLNLPEGYSGTCMPETLGTEGGSCIVFIRW